MNNSPRNKEKLNNSESMEEQLKDSPQTGTSTSFKVCLVLSVCFAIVDLFLHSEFMTWSSDLTASMQGSLKYPGFVISWILSYPLSFWPAIFVAVYFLFAKRFMDVVYYMFVYFTQMTIVVILKSVYGRGRPMIIGDTVHPYHCSCDYGMPSGHSSSALAAYFILEHWINSTFTKNSSKCAKLMVSISCYSTALLIGWSRMYMGVHSWNQILGGFLITIIMLKSISKQGLENLFKRTDPGTVKAISHMILLIVSVVTGTLFFVNRKRAQPKEWKYWSRCPVCEGTFANKQLRNTSFVFLYPGLILGLSTNLASKAKYLDPNRIKPKYFILKRFFYFLLGIGVISVIGFLLLLPFHWILESTTENKAIILSIQGALVFYFGGYFMITPGIHVFRKFKLEANVDFFHLRDEDPNLEGGILEENNQNSRNINTKNR